METTDPYNHHEYMEDAATKLKAIAHNSNAPRFFKSTGLASLDELLSRIGSVRLPALISEDGSDQVITDNGSDNPLAKPYYTFYIIYPAKAADDSTIFTARSNALATAKKVISRMRTHSRDLQYGLKDLDFNTIRIMGVGPIGDNGHGVMVTFTLWEPADIYYNATDWDN